MFIVMALPCKGHQHHKPLQLELPKGFIRKKGFGSGFGVIRRRSARPQVPTSKAMVPQQCKRCWRLWMNTCISDRDSLFWGEGGGLSGSLLKIRVVVVWIT